MKITTLRNYKTKLLKFKLLKTKTFKFEKDLNYLLLKNIETRLKKILHIIYRFHIANKKILFIGTPIKLNNQIKKLFKNKKHSFIPENIWMSGIITNSKSSFKHLVKQHAVNKNTTSKFLFNLKSQADLIVILNERSNLTALKESSLNRTPTISLNVHSNFFSSSLSTYKAMGNYSFTKKSIRNNLFFLLLNAVLKKAEQAKKQKIQYIKKQTLLKTSFNSKNKYVSKKKK
jgi:ribosomal protein S2